MNIRHQAQRLRPWLSTLLTLSLLIQPHIIRGAPKKSSKNNYLPPKPSSVRYVAPVRDSRVSITLIGNYLGYGLGFSYEKVFASYFHLLLAGYYTTAALQGEVADNVFETIGSQMVRTSLGFRFFLRGRHFFASTLNVSAISGDYQYEDKNGTLGTITIPYRTQLSHADLSFGTEWIIGQRYNITVDWLGIGIPIDLRVIDEGSADDNEVLRFLTQKTVGERLETEFIEQIRFFYLMTSIGFRF